MNNHKTKLRKRISILEFHNELSENKAEPVYESGVKSTQLFSFSDL